MSIRLTTYYNSKDLPSLPGSNVFHSSELFQVLEQTSGYQPIMLVATEKEKVIGKLLCITRRNFRLLGFTNKTYVYGTGEYFTSPGKEEAIFGEFLSYFTRRFSDQSFLIEFRNLEKPLFGYKYFRQNGYFPIRWLRVRNSIHHETIDKWMSASRKRQINHGIRNGAVIDIAHNEQDVKAFFSMLKKYYSPKIHRYLPDYSFFISLIRQSGNKELGKIFLVRYKNKIIGGAVCLFSGNTAYLLFSGGMRKTYARLYPGVLSVWNAMTYAAKHQYTHFEFIDAGLPFRKYSYRDFILRFGGKQLSSRRWFKIRWNWLNKQLIKIYV